MGLGITRNLARARKEWNKDVDEAGFPIHMELVSPIYAGRWCRLTTGGSPRYRVRTKKARNKSEKHTALAEIGFTVREPEKVGKLGDREQLVLGHRALKTRHDCDVVRPEKVRDEKGMSPRDLQNGSSPRSALM